MNAIICIGITVLCFGASGYASAANLKNLIPGLYGGHGITLAPPSGPFPNHAAHFSLDAAAAITQLNKNISAQIATFPLPLDLVGPLLRIQS